MRQQDFKAVLQTSSAGLHRQYCQYNSKFGFFISEWHNINQIEIYIDYFEKKKSLIYQFLSVTYIIKEIKHVCMLRIILTSFKFPLFLQLPSKIINVQRDMRQQDFKAVLLTSSAGIYRKY